MAYRETDRVRRRKAQTRDTLLRAAEDLLREGGFAGLTVQALAERAGVGVGTVYRYFESKDALATEVFRRATEREVSAVAEALAVTGTPVTRLRHALDVFATRALRAPRLAWALIAEPVTPDVDAQRLYYRSAYAGQFRVLIEEGIEAGLLPPQPADLCAAALVGALAEALVGPLADGRDGPQLVDSICDFCLRAVGAPADAITRGPRAALEVPHE